MSSLSDNDPPRSERGRPSVALVVIVVVVVVIFVVLHLSGAVGAGAH